MVTRSPYAREYTPARDHVHLRFDFPTSAPEVRKNEPGFRLWDQGRTTPSSDIASPEEIPMPEPAPQPSEPEPPRTRATGDASPPSQSPTPSKPPEEGVIFRALVDAGAEAVVAYTAEQRLRTMVSEAVAPQLEPFLVEMRQLFGAQERKLDALAADAAERDRKLATLVEGAAERDRRLDVLAARLDALKVLVHVVLGALALMTTVLIAVFGFVFTT